MTSFVQFAIAFTGGAGSLTATFGATATTGNMLVAGFVFASDQPPSIITSVTTTGGTGSDTFTFVNNFAGDGATNASTAVYFLPVCGAGRTGVIVNYTGGGFAELVIWEFSGLTSPTTDIIFTATPNTSTSITGTTGTLASSSEAAICCGNTSGGYQGYDGGHPLNPFSPVNGWTWDVTSIDTGSAYGYQTPGTNAALSVSLITDGGTYNNHFGVVTFTQGGDTLSGGMRLLMM